MGLEEQLKPFPWVRYSKKLAARIDKPRWVGQFTDADVEGRDVHLAIGREGEVEAGNVVQLYWLVDTSDGIIADAAFQALGQTALIGAADAACELARGKTYAQAGRIGADLIDRHLRDKSNEPSFPEETYPHLNLVVGAIDEAARSCEGIPLAEPFTPAPMEIGEVREGGYPGFDEMSDKQKLALIEQIVAEEIRPFIELDAGGIDLLDLVDGRKLIIGYQGACTTCHSATGMTLSYIQELLRAKVHPELVVEPDLSLLQEVP